MRIRPYWKEEYSSAKLWLVSGAVWMAIGTIFGSFSAIHLVAPDFFANISFMEFGRVRAVHVNTVLYGFITSMLIGAGLYIVPRVMNTKLFSEPIAFASGVLFNLGVLIGDIALLAGYTQGREYAEYIYPVDVMIILAFILLIADFTMTIVRRQETLMYISVWYFTGAVIWTTPMYFVGNVMWRPPLGAETGMVDALLLWFFGHGIFGLLVTPLALGVAYYMIPRVADAPLYSQLLGIIGFWSLFAFYGHIGGHHLLQAPIPSWMKAMSAIDSFAMMLPVATVLINFWYTARGRFDRFITNPAPKLMLFGTIWYALTCLQGPIQSLPSVQRVTHFNNWVIGHAHIAVLGFTGFIALGGMYYVLPSITGRHLFSVKLVNMQFWLILLGLSGFFLWLTVAGLIQGQAWLNGATVYRVIPEIKPYMVLRLFSGILIIIGALIGLYNVIMTFRRGKVIEP